MKTVGQILRKTRLALNIEISQVAKHTKIHPQYLEALEEDRYQSLPSSAVARGFIRNYAQFLSLTPDTLLAIFRRDFTEDKSGQIIPRGIVKPLSRERLVISPRHTIIASVLVVLLALFAYLYHEYRILVSPPSLTINYPKQNSEVRGPTIEISGKSEKEATVAVNSEKLPLKPDGSFTYSLTLPPGEHQILITSTLKDKTNTVTRTVQVIP